jgi:hypothetical protein
MLIAGPMSTLATLGMEYSRRVLSAMVYGMDGAWMTGSVAGGVAEGGSTRGWAFFLGMTPNSWWRSLASWNHLTLSCFHPQQEKTSKVILLWSMATTHAYYQKHVLVDSFNQCLSQQRRQKCLLAFLSAITKYGVLSASLSMLPRNTLMIFLNTCRVYHCSILSKSIRVSFIYIFPKKGMV